MAKNSSENFVKHMVKNNEKKKKNLPNNDNNKR